VADLGEAMQEADGMVRSHVAWALGKIGGGRAKAILETALPRETIESTRKEIAAALAVV